EAFGLVGDITSENDLENIYETINESYGKIDFLILNAGVVNVSLLENYTDYHKMKEEIDIDLWGTILSTRIFLPLLKPKSIILMISSAFGLFGGAGYSVYCAAKAGIINFADALRRELLYKDISVHVACSADIDTPLLAKETKSMPDWMLAEMSSRQGPMAPSKAAKIILKQCDKKRFMIITGSQLVLILFLKKILPQKIMRYLLDKTVPRPK
ncbi:SDR family NAD(P)-dependent oxidoreductase, partial [Elusimicrobiota bacterium]